MVNKIADKEADMVAMRKQFLKDNQEKHEADNYEFRRRDKDDKVTSIDGLNEQPKEKRQKKKNDPLIYLFIYFCFEHVYFKSQCETLRFRNYLGLLG